MHRAQYLHLRLYEESSSSAMQPFTYSPSFQKSIVKNGLCFSEAAYLPVHKFSLFCVCHQVNYRILAYRYICKEPDKFCPHLYHVIKKLITPYRLVVFACIAAGYTKGSFFLSGPSWHSQQQGLFFAS